MCHYLHLASIQYKRKDPLTTMRTPQFYKRRMAAAPIKNAAKDDATTALPAPVNGIGDLVALAAPVAWIWPSEIWVTTAGAVVGAWTCPSEIWVTGLPVAEGAWTCPSEI